MNQIQDFLPNQITWSEIFLPYLESIMLGGKIPSNIIKESHIFIGI